MTRHFLTLDSIGRDGIQVNLELATRLKAIKGKTPAALAGGRLAPWPPWPSLVAHGLSAAGATWSPNGTEIALDKGGSLLVLSRTRLLSTVRAPNDSVVEWAASHPSGESTFDQRWH